MNPSGNLNASHPDLLHQFSALSELLFDDARVAIAREQRRPINEHVADYRTVLHSRGGKKHANAAARRLRVMLRLSRAKIWMDLTKSRVEIARAKLMQRRPRRATVSPATSNHYLNSLKGFCNWMAEERADRSPCRGIKPLHTRSDLRRKRRALTPAEVLRLIQAATVGREIAGIPGSERALTYVLATTTGLRSAEIQSLRRSSFHLGGEEPRVIVDAAYTKNGEQANVPLRSDVAALVGAYLALVERDDRLFRRTANGMYSMMIDLREAGISYCLNGEYADFHALRHTFVSNLFEMGATPKEAQTLARHQDARLTLGRYAHVTPTAQRAAIERLPSIARK